MFVFEEVSTCFGLPIEIGRTHLTRCIEFFSDSFSEVLLLIGRAAAAASAAAAAETSSEYFDFCSAFFRFETKAEFFFKQENKVAPFFFVARLFRFFRPEKVFFCVAKISSSVFYYKKFKPFQEKCKIFYRSVTRKCFELELCCNRRLP